MKPKKLRVVKHQKIDHLCRLDKPSYTVEEYRKGWFFWDWYPLTEEGWANGDEYYSSTIRFNTESEAVAFMTKLAVGMRRQVADHEVISELEI